MKKFLLAAVCAICALTASAQRASSTSSSFFSTEKADQGVTIGIRAGLNFAKWTGDFDEPTDTRTAFHVGVIADIPLMQSLYIQSGLYFQSKGCKFEEEMYNWSEKVTTSPMYLEIPILASYRYDFGDAAQLQVNFGPYFAVGIAGKYKEEIEDGSDFYKTDVDIFDSDEGLLNRFDCGLQVGAGVTFAQHYYLGFAYQFGLTNMTNEDNVGSEVSTKNSNWMLSLGYNF